MTKTIERDRMCLVFATISGNNVTFKQIPAVEYENESGRYFLPKLDNGKARNEKQFRDNWESILTLGGIQAIGRSVVRTDININSLRQMPVWEDMTPRQDIKLEDWQAMTTEERNVYSAPVLTRAQKEAALACFKELQERNSRASGGNVYSLVAA